MDERTVMILLPQKIIEMSYSEMPASAMQNDRLNLHQVVGRVGGTLQIQGLRELLVEGMAHTERTGSSLLRRKRRRMLQPPSNRFDL